jgi:hypothetical protein
MGTKDGRPGSDYDGVARNGANVSRVQATGVGLSEAVGPKLPGWRSATAAIEPLRELKLRLEKCDEL